MLEQMKEIILQYVDTEPEKITSDSNLIEELHLSSYDFMDLLGQIEETFDVTVDEQDKEILDILTVGDLISYIEKLKK